MPARSEQDPGMRLRPMVHVEDMAASVAFYEQLGATVVHGSRDGDWALMALGQDRIGLLAHPPNPEQREGTVELNFEATSPSNRSKLGCGRPEPRSPVPRPTRLSVDNCR